MYFTRPNLKANSIKTKRTSYFGQILWRHFWKGSQHWRRFCVEQRHFVGVFQFGVNILGLVQIRIHGSVFSHQHSSIITEIVLNRRSSHLERITSCKKLMKKTKPEILQILGTESLNYSLRCVFRLFGTPLPLVFHHFSYQ